MSTELLELREFFDDGYEFLSCFIRRKNIIAFTAINTEADDPLETERICIFLYLPEGTPDEPDDRWNWAEIGAATGFHGCAVFEPEERCIFVTDDGEVYILGKGEADWEKPVWKERRLYFRNVKSVRGGHAIAVGHRRNVYLRKAANNWVRLDNGLFPQGEDTELDGTGFDDIDGFSEEDVYACGGKGDLWHYDGNVWTQVDIPTNRRLKQICCAEDDIVYITMDNNDVIRGRNDVWGIIGEDKPDEGIESIVSFNGQVLFSTESEIYTIDGEQFVPADLGNMPEMNAKSYLAAGDGILVVAGSDEAAMYDGKEWTVILESEE
jgi:hypothetical protein